VQLSTPKDCKSGLIFKVHHIIDVLARPFRQRWLIEDLWLTNGVGILAGHPKTGKTFCAAQFALAVAANAKVFGRYPVRRPGPVLFYGAEDGLEDLRERFAGLAQIYSLDLKKLPIYLLEAPVLRLDRESDLELLREEIAKLKPRLLVLDPFVRMARIDENSAADVSGVLGSLREIQRTYDLAILLVHHARKSPAANPTQAFRGSSDFAAWSDSNLYLGRHTNRLTLTLEHRSAASPEPIDLRLVKEPIPHLCLLENIAPSEAQQYALDALQQEILEHMETSRRPMSTVELRKLLCKRKEEVVRALGDLVEVKRVVRTNRGWILASVQEDLFEQAHAS
jgi:hypothetical protein